MEQKQRLSSFNGVFHLISGKCSNRKSDIYQTAHIRVLHKNSLNKEESSQLLS